jgi:cobalt-zinc-cadmium efflux system outer membrane protein
MLLPRTLDGDPSRGLPAIGQEAALARALAQSPELAAARAAKERSELALKRARREPVPDLRLRGGPRYNRELLEAGPRGAEPVGWEGALEVGVTVPLFDRNQGNVAAAQADLVRADRELTRVDLALRARLAEAFERYANASRISAAYRDEVLPRAEEAYRLYLTKYREMAASYPQVLIARRTLVQANERYLDALEEVWRASVEIDGFLLSGGLAVPGRSDF